MLCFSFLCFPSLWGDFFFLLPATKGSEAGGGRDPRARDPPRTLGGDLVSGMARLTGMWWGPCGEEQAWRPVWADPYGGGHRDSPLSLRGLTFKLIFNGGPGGLSPAALVTGMEPCECSCAPPGLVSGRSQPPPPPPPHRLHPRGSGWSGWHSRRCLLATSPCCARCREGARHPLKTQNLP